MHFPSSTYLLLLLLPLTIAHVRLETPTPYNPATLNSNPLLPTGLDYPCKNLRPAPYLITNLTTIPHSTPLPLRFIGQATHGGGSCQISLSRDVPPSAASVFKVIKSIEGGCPSSKAGNVGTDTEGYGADGFEYVVPEGVGVGDFTLAWTWFNKVGEREMYMNCAPVRVVAAVGAAAAAGGGRRRARRERGVGWDELPVMFRANIGHGCGTAASGTVLEFPKENLGKVVQRIGDEVLVPPVGNCGKMDGGALASQAVASSVVVPSAAPPTLVSAPSALMSPPASQASPAPAVSAMSPAPPPAQASQPLAAPSVNPAAVTSADGLTTGECPSPGRSVCAPDGKSWGTCSENHRVIFQAVAAGTRCDLALGVELPA